MLKSRFVEKSLEGALSFATESIFAEELASRKGFLQSLDPRVKALTLGAFVVLALFVKSLAILGILYAGSLLLAALSEIRLSFFLKRTWIFIPLFSLFIATPALFSFVTPGEALLRVGPWTITRPGALGAAFFVCRVATSVSFAVLLSITTRHFELLKVLRVFGIPSLFVMVLGMAYRYICLFVEMLAHTFLAIKSRVGSITRTRSGQRLVAWNIASLWARSFQLNERVYEAMLSRGYRGEPVLLHNQTMGPRDWAWVTVAFAFITALVWAGARNLL